MSPYQHGEVFVTDDGAETDLDLGHYERFTGRPACQADNITTGRIYQEIIGKERPRGSTAFIHLTLVPYIPSAGELKTKPTQHSVKELRSIGIQPDVLLCRTDRQIPKEERRKLGLFCNVRESAVIEARDVDNIYAVPEAYHAAGLDDEVLAAFGIESGNPPALQSWHVINQRI